MRTLTETQLLNVWEHCADLPLIDTSLHLLGAASPGTDLSGIAALSIGQRDARLLELRESLFGSRLKNMAICPHCTERIEWENNLNELRLQPLLPGFHKIFSTEIEGFHIRYRLPTTQDLLDLKQHPPRSQANELLNQCIVEIQKDDVSVTGIDLPESIISELNKNMGLQDPQADITMLLSCPACSGQWESAFDIVSYLWSEINSWARHMLQEIYILAKFFGWSERDILEIGPKRRQLYLEMVRA